MYGQMVQSMKGIGLIIGSVVMAFTYGKMEESFMGNGKIMIWKVLGFTIGEMEEVIRGNIIMIRSQGMGNISGQMGGSMKGGGLRENNMDWACILILINRKLSMDCGKMEKDLSGLMNRISN